MKKQWIIKVPPRPAVIRERYAAFLADFAASVERYKHNYLCGMQKHFAEKQTGKLRSENH